MSQPFGNVLNNIRLLKQNKYEISNQFGDFNYILVRLVLVNLIFVFIGTIVITKDFSIITILLMLLFSSASLLKDYFIVEFRVHLDFMRILLSHIIMVFGYLLGLLLFTIGIEWQIIYILGLSFVLFFFYMQGSYMNEPCIKGSDFGSTLKDFAYLFSSVFLKSSLKHIDKLILLFLISSSAVAIYYIATFPSKIVSLTITPISGVLLSHLRNIKHFSVKSFTLSFVLLVLVGIIGYVFVIAIGPFILQHLYSEWAEESIKLLYITGITALFTGVRGFLNPIILRFRPIKWQFRINLVYFITNVISAVMLALFYGLFGFVLGLAIAKVVNIIGLVLVYVFTGEPKE